MKIIITLLFGINILFGSCIDKVIQDDRFVFKTINSTEYLGDGTIRKVRKNVVNNFPECNIDRQFLFQFEYREDLKDILLIQLLFKSNLNNNSFKEYVQNLIYEIQDAVNNVSTYKDIVIEVKNINTRYTIIYKFDKYLNEIKLTSDGVEGKK